MLFLIVLYCFLTLYSVHTSATVAQASSAGLSVTADPVVTVTGADAMHSGRKRPCKTKGLCSSVVFCSTPYF